MKIMVLKHSLGSHLVNASHLNIRVSIPATPLQRVELLVSFFSLGIYEVSLNLLKEKNNKYSASKSLFIACQCPPLLPYSVDRTDLQKEG